MNENIPPQQYGAGQHQQGWEHLPQSYGPPPWVQPGTQQPYPDLQPAQQPEPRRKHPIARHIWRNFFRYFFFCVQAIFIIWLIGGLASTSGSGAGAHTQAVQYCAGNGWQPLYKSYSDCVTHYGNTLNGAADAGKGIAVGLIIGLWVAVDVILGIGRIVVLLGRRYSGAHR
jgi:hypothetical protein